MVSFEMVGRLNIGKESEKFNPYELAEYPSGWQNRTLKFNCLSGSNRFNLMVKGGCFKDEHNDIFVIGKDGKDENGETIKGDKFYIPFKERLTHPRLQEVAEFKKFIIDLEVPGLRWKLKNALDKVKEGHEFTEAELKELGIEKVEELEAAYEKSCKKRKEFITEWDYAEFIHKVITSGKYKDKKFKIYGEHQFQYGENKQRFYENFIPNRMYLVNDDEVEMAEETATVYFNNESLVDASKEKGLYYVNAKVLVYNKERGEIPCDYTFAFEAGKEDDAMSVKKASKLIDIFTVDKEDQWKQIGIVNKLLDGSQSKEITLEDLDEETQDNIMFGLTTLEDVQKELGGTVYGDKVKMAVLSKFARGYSKGIAEDTAYTNENFVVKPLGSEDEEGQEEDLFDESSDDDLF